MPVDLAIGLSSTDANPEDSVDDYVYRQQESAAEAYRQVREHLQTSAERQKNSYDTRVRAAPFELHQWVWYHYPRKYQGRSPKWQKNYIGPYLIVRCIPPVNYVLQRTRHSKPFVVHADKIKRCYGETPASWISSDNTSASTTDLPGVGVPQAPAQQVPRSSGEDERDQRASPSGPGGTQAQAPRVQEDADARDTPGQFVGAATPRRRSRRPARADMDGAGEGSGKSTPITGRTRTAPLLPRRLCVLIQVFVL